MEKKSSKFATLEIGRGLAAILVVLFHIQDLYFDTDKYWPEPLLGGLFGFGRSGVEFFFVLSGFVMIWSHFDDLGRPERVRSFAIKRIIRIYPLSVATVLVMALLYAMLPSSGTWLDRDPANIVESLALFGREPLNALNFPTWTLWHENIFYLFCALIIAAPRIGLAVFGCWSVICFSLPMAFPTESQFYFFRPINGLFALGVAIAFYLKRQSVPAPRVCLLLGVVGFLSAGLLLPDRERTLVEVVLYGSCSALIIAGGVQLERESPISFSIVPDWLGRISYSLYLTHMITLAVLAKLFLFLGFVSDKIPGPVVAVLFLGPTLIVADLVSRFYEIPVSRWLKHRLRWLDGNGSQWRG